MTELTLRAKPTAQITSALEPSPASISLIIARALSQRQRTSWSLETAV